MSRRKPALAAGALATLMLAGVASHGANLTVTPMFNSRFEVDTNRRLLFDDPEDAAGAILEFGAEVQSAGPTYDFRATPMARVLQFTNAQNPDREELTLDLTGQRSWERLVFFTSVTAERTAAIDAELSQVGFNFRNLNRDEISIAPGVTYQLTPRWALTGAVFWQDVAFEDDPTSRLIDFRFWSTSLASEYQITPNLSLTSRLELSRFESPESDSNTKTYTAWLGGSANISPKINAEVRAGVNHSELEFQSLDIIQLPGLPPVPRSFSDSRDESGYVVDANLARVHSTLTLKLGYSRTLSPSSRGAQSITDQYSLDARRRLSNRLLLRANVRFLDRTAEGNAVTGLDVEFLTTSLVLNWRATDSLDVRAGYRYRWRSFEDESATGHAVQLSFDYSLEPFRLF